MKYFVRMVLMILLFFMIISGCSKEQNKTVEELNNDSISLIKQNNIPKALNVAEKALKKAEDEYGYYHPAVLNSLQIKALIYQAQADYLNAEYTYKEALSLSNEINGANSLDSLKILNNIAGIKYLQNQFASALSFYKQALGIAETLLETDDPLLQQIQVNMATCEESVKKSGGVSEANTEVTQTSENDITLAQGKDFVPNEVKKAALKNLADQNILLSNPKPLRPIQIRDQGMVFPYLYNRKIEDNNNNGGNGEKVVLLFAATINKNKEVPPDSEEGAFYVFSVARMVSYESYVEEIERGTQETAIPALISVFPNLYSLKE